MKIPPSEIVTWSRAAKNTYQIWRRVRKRWARNTLNFSKIITYVHMILFWFFFSRDGRPPGKSKWEVLSHVIGEKSIIRRAELLQEWWVEMLPHQKCGPSHRKLLIPLSYLRSHSSFSRAGMGSLHSPCRIAAVDYCISVGLPSIKRSVADWTLYCAKSWKHHLRTEVACYQ